MPPAGNFLLVQKVPQKIPPAGSPPDGRHSPLTTVRNHHPSVGPRTPSRPPPSWLPGLPQTAVDNNSHKQPTSPPAQNPLLTPSQIKCFIHPGRANSTAGLSNPYY